MNRLKIFHTVAATLNFTRAAEELHLTQPGISKHIRALEEQYGTPLFDRLGKKTVLTQAGEILHRATTTAFASLDEASSRIADLHTLAGGSLNIGGSITIATYILPTLLTQFRKIAAGVDISVATAFSSQIVERVLDNSLELGFVGHYHPAPMIAAQVFMADRMILVVSSQHPWAERKRPVRLSEFASETLLISKRGSGTWRFFADLMYRAGVEPGTIMELGTTEGVKQGVAAGLGISLLARHVAANEVDRGILHEVPLDCTGLERNLYLVYHKDRYLSQAAQAFIELANQDCRRR